MECVCVCLRACVCVCVCEIERERERERESSLVEPTTHNRGLCANTYELHYCVCHATLFPFQAWTDGKTKDIINCLYFSFESWSSQLWKGSYISDTDCDVRPITMHWVSWPIRADCACWKEGFCRKQMVWERGWRGGEGRGGISTHAVFTLDQRGDEWILTSAHSHPLIVGSIMKLSLTADPQGDNTWCLKSTQKTGVQW